MRKHLRGNPGACLAVVVQAVEWGMSPFAVANKSYNVNDQLAFESQLIQAVILKRAPIKGRFKVEYTGQGGKRVCRVWAELKDEPGEIVEYTSPELDKITPKNSPLWKSDPDQQQFYYSGRALCRRHFPDVLLGVYADDEVAAPLAAVGPDRAVDVSPRRSIAANLDALAAKPSAAVAAHDPETGEISGRAEPGDQVEREASESVSTEEQPDSNAVDDAPAVADTPPDPAKPALLERLRQGASKGSKTLRMRINSLSEEDQDRLTSEDHDALWSIAKLVDGKNGEAA